MFGCQLWSKAGLGLLVLCASHAFAQAPAPLVANTWLQLPYESSKAGPRVCPVGVALQDTFVDRCGDKRSVDVAQYGEALAQACKGYVLVSAMPEQHGMIGHITIGFYKPAGATCNIPAGARAPGTPRNSATF